MKGFDLKIHIDDREFYEAFLKAIGEAYVDFIQTFHQGMMMWTFHFKPEDYQAVTDANAAAMKERYG